MIIAIDGPAGAGKSTIAKLIAKRFGIVYIDTGAMYRAIGLKAHRSGIRCTDEEKIAVMLKTTDIKMRNDNGEQRVFLDGEDVSAAIRRPEISKMASDISAVPQVRYAMVDMQRKLASDCDTVLDGRDIGTFVLPEAECKIFLTASADERASRRYKELVARGEKTTLEEVKEDILRRDYNDSHRALAPLRKADDAVEVDTTGMSIEQVCARITEIAEEKMRKKDA